VRIASVIYVPPAFAADAIMEAGDAGIPVVVLSSLREFPVSDMVRQTEYLNGLTEPHSIDRSQLPGHHLAGQVQDRDHDGPYT
jgi:hypothetical protein